MENRSWSPSPNRPRRKRYVVKLDREERVRLEAMLRKGKHRGPVLTKARILLKADVSEFGEGWNDSRIVEALGTNASTVHRVRKQLVEEGLDADRSAPQRAVPETSGPKRARALPGQA